MIEKESNIQDAIIIKEMEEKYPQMTSEFKKITEEMYLVFCKKQKNYGPHNISLGTDLKSSEDRKLSLTGLFFRMNDKIQRIKQLIVLNQEDVVGEPVSDTFQDLSVYGIISQIIFRGKWGK